MAPSFPILMTSSFSLVSWLITSSLLFFSESSADWTSSMGFDSKVVHSRLWRLRKVTKESSKKVRRKRCFSVFFTTFFFLLSDYVTVGTESGEQISQLIGGYIGMMMSSWQTMTSSKEECSNEVISVRGEAKQGWCLRKWWRHVDKRWRHCFVFILSLDILLKRRRDSGRVESEEETHTVIEEEVLTEEDLSDTSSFPRKELVETIEVPSSSHPRKEVEEEKGNGSHFSASSSSLFVSLMTNIAAMQANFQKRNKGVKQN